MEPMENDVLLPPEEQAPAKPKKEKLTRKERRKRWKAAKKARRDAEKEYYRYAPWGKRVWNLYLKKPVSWVFGVLLIGVLLIASFGAIADLIGEVFNSVYTSVKDKPLSDEDLKKLYELSPLDEEGAKRIDALPAVGENETWTICVYLVGADLEDGDENDLSYVTKVLTKEAREENSAESKAHQMDCLTRFNEELKESGLELPAFFYYPEKPVASSTTVTEEVVVSDRPGAASTDIGEMTAETWSDNIQIVIQTGGATRWSNSMVNPNRTQRFLYKGGEFIEVADLPLVPSSTPDTLADFLRFCKKECPADHTMLVLWNHGGGPFGYGNDSIYSGSFSLKDIREALSAVYSPSRTDPAFDIIGFDACLMSTLEVTHALDGFADYYCLSEETEPGDGWDYTPVLQAMTEDPTMSPAKVAQKIADCYSDFYVRENINFPIIQWDVTFSVIDAGKAAELYEAYCALCQAQLLDSFDDLGVLAEIGRCSGKATHYAGSYSNVYNSVDLGNYMDYLGDSYPEECARVKELLHEAVLYHRQNGGLSDSTGMAVYVPSQIDEISGLIQFLRYVYDISENDSVTALYYYKQAGCLNDELKEAVSLMTDKEPRVLDVSAFRQFAKTRPETDDSGFRIPVSAELQNLLVDYELELSRYDEDKDLLTDYGRENCLILDGEGRLASDFDGKWICLDGQPLDVEIISSSAAATDYRAHILYNGDEAWLELSCDRDTDEVHISGVRLVPAGLMEDVNYLNNTRSREEVEYGAKITPIYNQTDLSDNSTCSVKGRTVTFNKSGISLRREALPAGSYLSSAVISDTRGDNYYSGVISSTMSGGTMSGWAFDSRFYGRDY
ncbi:MAG: hypothetical protein IKS55_14385 [Oscillospiraceae bacterium]|nr:hypothetical protein [Oscillospiraceae bacterium]